MFILLPMQRSVLVKVIATACLSGAGSQLLNIMGPVWAGLACSPATLAVW